MRGQLEVTWPPPEFQGFQPGPPGHVLDREAEIRKKKSTTGEVMKSHMLPPVAIRQLAPARCNKSSPRKNAPNGGSGWRDTVLAQGMAEGVVITVMIGLDPLRRGVGSVLALVLRGQGRQRRCI